MNIFSVAGLFLIVLGVNGDRDVGVERLDTVRHRSRTDVSALETSDKFALPKFVLEGTNRGRIGPVFRVTR